MVAGRGYSPAAIGRLMWRRRWLIGLPFVIVTAAAVGFSYSLPNLYRAETTILLIPQRVPETYVRTTVTARLEDRLRTISQQILSRTRLEQIIKEFNLYPEQSQTTPMEQLVGFMRGQVNLDIVRADSFKLAFTYGDPEIAAKVSTRLSSLFIDENLRDRELQADGTSRFLEAQLNDARQRLIQQEKRLEEYRRLHSGSLPSQMPSNIQGIQLNQQQIVALNEATNRLRDRRVVLERLIHETDSTATAAPPVAPPVPGTDPTAVQGGTPAQQLDAARRNLQALQLRLRPEHPDVQRTLRQIQDLEAKVREEAATEQANRAPAAPPPANPAVAAARNRLAELRGERVVLDRQIAHNEAEEGRLRGVIAAYQARLEELPKRESELTELTRDYATLQQSYQALLTKREDSVVAANLERRQIGEQFRVIDPARVPEIPASPNRFFINVAGAIFGLLLGLGTSGLLEFLDTTMRTDDEIAATLGLATLAIIPLVVTSAERRARKRRTSLAVAAVTLTMMAGAGFAAWWKFGMGR